MTISHQASQTAAQSAAHRFPPKFFPMSSALHQPPHVQQRPAPVPSRHPLYTEPILYATASSVTCSDCSFCPIAACVVNHGSETHNREMSRKVNGGTVPTEQRHSVSSNNKIIIIIIVQLHHEPAKSTRGVGGGDKIRGKSATTISG